MRTRRHPKVSEAQLVPASDTDRANGFLGYVAIVVENAIRLDSISLRRTLAGKLALSFPRRIDPQGHQHYYSLPIDDDVRQSIEAQVFDLLDLREGDAR